MNYWFNFQCQVLLGEEFYYYTAVPKLNAAIGHE